MWCMGSVASLRMRASLPTARNELYVAGAADSGCVGLIEAADCAARLLARGCVFAREKTVLGVCSCDGRNSSNERDRAC